MIGRERERDDPRGDKTYVAQANILNEPRVNPTALLDLLQDGIDQVFQRSVFKATFPRLGQGCPDRQGDDDIVGIFGGSAGVQTVSFFFLVGVCGKAYIADKGLPGDRCLRMEPRRSTAIVDCESLD